MKKRVLIIGGAGFLGKAVVRELCTRADFQIIVCDSKERVKRANLHGATCVDYDFGQDDPGVIPCERGDVAIVLSWRGYPAKHEISPVDSLAHNLRHTFGLANHLLKNGIEQLAYASSGGAVYGSGGAVPVTEQTLPKPVGFYGIAKRTTEMYLENLFRNSHAKCLIFRIGNVYGSDQIRDNLSVGFVARAVQAASRGGVLPIWGNGEIRRDYVYINDVADAIVTAVDSNSVTSGTYNIGTGIAHSGREVVQLVQKVLGLELHVSYSAARLFDVDSIALDSTLLTEAVGWQASTSLERGILDLHKSLLEDRS